MRRLFWLVAAVLLVDTMFLAAVAPLLPHYTDEFELSKTGAGILAAAYPLGSLAATVPSAWLALRWGTKRLLVLGLGLIALASVAFAFANDIVVLDAARFVQGIGGAASWAGGMGWLVSATPTERRGRVIGAAFSAAIVGVVLGPVLGGLATALSPEAVFSAVGALAAGLAVWAGLIPGREAPPEGAGLRGMLAGLLRPALITSVWLYTLPSMFAGVVEVLVPLRLDHLGATGTAIGAVFLVSAVFEAVISPLAGRASDRVGRLLPVRIGLVGAAVMAVVLPFPGTAVLVGIAVVVTFVALAGFWAPATAMLSDAAEEAGLDQALAFAISNAAWAIGHGVGGAGGAALADATSDAVPYGLLGAISLATLVLVREHGRRLEPSVRSASV